MRIAGLLVWLLVMSGAALAQCVLSTEDPRDAERLGFAEEIRALKPGDPITVVGWPDRFKKREIRGHQLHYPDGLAGSARCTEEGHVRRWGRLHL